MAAHNPKAGARDMVLSLLVLFIPIMLIVAFFQQTPEEPTVPPVDWKGTLALARGESSFPVMAPAELPAQWRATSTYWGKAGTAQVGRQLSADEYSLGVLGADNRNIMLKQSSAPLQVWLRVVTRDAVETGKLTIDGVEWTSYLSADGRTHYLSRSVGESTVLISGDFEQQPLVDYAGLLTDK